MANAVDVDDEPVAKKMKTEESLIPEAQFIAQNKVSNAYIIHICISYRMYVRIIIMRSSIRYLL